MNNTDSEQKKWEIPGEAAQELVPTKPQTNHKPLIITVFLVVAAAISLWLFLFRTKADPPPPPDMPVADEIVEQIAAPLAHELTKQTESTAKAIVPLSIPLAESDEPLRQKAIGGLGQSKMLGALLKEEGLISRFVAICNAIALGESPAKLMPSLAPESKFKVRFQDERIFVDPASYSRYDSLVNLLLSLNTDYCVELYLSFEPQIEDAYRELGQDNATPFIEIVKKAVRQLQQTPIPPDQFELIEMTLSYACADQNLEELNAAQKHFLRFGPAHLRQLKGKITLLLDTLLAKKQK